MISSLLYILVKNITNKLFLIFITFEVKITRVKSKKIVMTNDDY